MVDDWQADEMFRRTNVMFSYFLMALGQTVQAVGHSPHEIGSPERFLEILERNVRDVFDDDGLPLVDHDVALQMVSALSVFVLDPEP